MRQTYFIQNHIQRLRQRLFHWLFGNISSYVKLNQGSVQIVFQMRVFQITNDGNGV